MESLPKIALPSPAYSSVKARIELSCLYLPEGHLGAQKADPDHENLTVQLQWEVILLYGAETSRTTNPHMEKCSHSSTTVRIFPIRWPVTIGNLNLWERTCRLPLEAEISKKRCCRVGHSLRKLPTNIRHDLRWNPKGKRKREAIQQNA